LGTSSCKKLTTRKKEQKEAGTFSLFLFLIPPPHDDDNMAGVPSQAKAGGGDRRLLALVRAAAEDEVPETLTASLAKFTVDEEDESNEGGTEADEGKAAAADEAPPPSPTLGLGPEGQVQAIGLGMVGALYKLNPEMCFPVFPRTFQMQLSNATWSLQRGALRHPRGVRVDHRAGAPRGKQPRGGAVQAESSRPASLKAPGFNP
jgi:hypothetical protein